MKEIHEKLAAAYGEHIETNGASSTLTKAGYYAVLPETVTAEQADTLNAHHKDSIPALTMAFGKVNIDVLAKNPEFQSAEGTADLGGTTKVHVVTERVGQRISAPPKEGQAVEKVEVKGLTSVKVTTPGGKAVKDARAWVANLGADKL